MDKNSAASLNRLPNEPAGAWQMLLNILPRHVHDVNDFVLQFL